MHELKKFSVPNDLHQGVQLANGLRIRIGAGNCPTDGRDETKLMRLNEIRSCRIPNKQAGYTEIAATRPYVRPLPEPWRWGI